MYDHDGIKLGINNRKIKAHSSNIWNSVTHFHKIQGVVSREIRKCFELSKDTTYQNLWDASETVLKETLHHQILILEKNTFCTLSSLFQID